MLRALVSRVVLAILVGLFAFSPSGCEPSGRAAKLQVAVLDETLRVPGSPCAGTQPFLYVHHTAPYRIEDSADGTTLVSGELPDGVAVRVLEEPLAVEREPTNCEFTFDVRLPERERYRLVLEQGDPFPFSLDDLETNDARLRFTIP
jgi:hypothetical protein